MRMTLKDLANLLNLENLEVSAESPEELIERTSKEESVDVVMSEPNFSLCLLPWHQLRFWFCLDKMNKKKTLKVMPISAALFAMPVEFDHLWKIRAPVGNVEGFDLQDFDNLIMVYTINL